MTFESDLQAKVDIVLQKLQLHSPVLLGKGGEGPVFEYGSDALKVYPRDVDLQYLKNIQLFQDGLSKHQFSFDTPQIYEIEEADGVPYTLEKRLRGVQMDKKIVGMNTKDRQKLYRSYYEAIRQVHAVSFPDRPFGHLIETPEMVMDSTWPGFLVRMLDQKIAKTQDKMRTSVVDFDNKVQLFKSLINLHLASDRKDLVHCDYFLNNVLVDDNLAISAVLDFSAHAAAGDPRLDIAGVLAWNEIDPNVHTEDYDFLYDIARKDYGEDIAKFADLYLLYSSFYFADMDDPSFSIKKLNDEKLWDKYR